MNFLSCRLSRVLTVIIFSFFCVSGSSAPSEISSLAVAGGRLFAGTTSGISGATSAADYVRQRVRFTNERSTASRLRDMTLSM
jgi:hypothetical protein